MRLDRAAPNFDTAELLALAGPPLWQATHEAKVVDVSEAAVAVEVTAAGQTVRAVVKPAEFTSPPAVGATVRVRLGDPPKKPEEPATASVREARALDLLAQVGKAHEGRGTVPGVILREVKGGYSVALHAEGYAGADDVTAPAIRAFLPKSHATLQRGGWSWDVVGESDEFNVTELEVERANVVVSRKARLVAAHEKKLDELWQTLKEGDLVKGTVRSIVPFGAFLDIGGVDGLLHVSDLAWESRPRIESMVHVGQTIDVKIIALDRGAKKLKLGLKQTKPDPWGHVNSAFKSGTDVEGTVVAITDFGVFVKLQDGVEGLIHLSEMSWQRVKHPSQKFHIGQPLKVRVLGIDPEHRRISLSSKALEKNPFEAIAEKFPTGTVVRAKVKSLADFGAFIELGDGVDGMIHVGELSWTDHVNHPSEVLTIGQEVEAVVMNVDVAKQRVGCSIKRTKENPFNAWESKYHKGARMTLKVTRTDERGAYFEAEDGLTIFCNGRDLSAEGHERASDTVKTGQMIEVEVKAFDRRFRKVSVSAKAVTEGETREAYDEYLKKERGNDRMTLGDALKGKLKPQG
jgi:small subunit ribosomal protein S1